MLRLSDPVWTPGPTEPDRPKTLTPAEQRRLRRMISNRESARRSRMRKQRHLEDLRSHASRLKMANRELANRIGAVSYQTLLFRTDNDRLLSESAILRKRLYEIRRILVCRQLQQLSSPPPPPPAAAAAFCGGFLSGNEQTLASLIA